MSLDSIVNCFEPDVASIERQLAGIPEMERQSREYIERKKQKLLRDLERAKLTEKIAAVENLVNEADRKLAVLHCNRHQLLAILDKDEVGRLSQELRSQFIKGINEKVAELCAGIVQVQDEYLAHKARFDELIKQQKQ